MKKKSSTILLVATSIIIAILTIIAFINYYFIKPIVAENEKKDISAEEKRDLELLTMAYLSQNVGLSLNDSWFNAAENRKYEVAAQYYYLKNGRDHINEYDKILDLARLFFDDNSVDFTNFEINVDKDRCGKEKYSTIEGFISSDTCDKENIVYKIMSAYYQNYEYVVEFYAANAIQIENEVQEKCDNFEIPFSYKIRLIDLEDQVFYDNDNFRCCSKECVLEGINPVENEIISQVETHTNVYKLTFKKIDGHFVFSKINKV